MKQTFLSTRIRDIMTKRGLTQQDLATLLQVSQPAISLYLKGRVPPAAILHKIAGIGGTSVEWLLTGSGASKALKAREKIPEYGRQHKLLELWETLTPSVQKNLLMLMQHLAGKTGE
jgi:transcriptional regulator with XRE-family HTH domain